jgi:hypothetical protein
MLLTVAEWLFGATAGRVPADYPQAGLFQQPRRGEISFSNPPCLPKAGFIKGVRKSVIPV